MRPKVAALGTRYILIFGQAPRLVSVAKLAFHKAPEGRTENRQG